LRLTRQRYGGFVARGAAAYSYIHAVGAAFLKKSVGWQPTNTKSTDVSPAYREQLTLVTLYLLAYVACVAFVIREGAFQIFNIQYYALLPWVVYNIIATSIILANLYSVVVRARYKKPFAKLQTTVALSPRLLIRPHIIDIQV
jgi:hypothetical protein